MHAKKHVATAAAFIGAAFAGNALAQNTSEPHCGTFVVYGEIEAWHVLDHGEEGETAGDQRTMRVSILDEDGNQIGVSHSVVTYLPEMGGGPIIHSSSYHMFANGSLALLSVIPSTNTDAGPTFLEHIHERAVMGGTGDFTHASGTATAVTLEDGTRQLVYDLICPS